MDSDNDKDRPCLTIIDICKAWYQQDCIAGDVPSTHTITRSFRMGDRAPETVSHVLLKYQPYLKRYARRNFPDRQDEAEEAYVEFVLDIVKQRELFDRKYEKTLRSFVFRYYKSKLLNTIRRNDRWLGRSRQTIEHVIRCCTGQEPPKERAIRRCLALSHKIFINGHDRDKALLMGITETDRAVWIAYWEDRMTEAAIGERLNLSANAISSRIGKVKKYLRDETLSRLNS